MIKNTIEQKACEPGKDEILAFHRNIAKNVARIRKQKSFSQLDLSLAIGYKSVSLVAGAEAGYHNIHFNIEHLYRISRALEVPITEFFTESPAKST